MYVVLNNSGEVVGVLDGAQDIPGLRVLPAPPDFDPAHASEYRLQGQTLIRDPAIVLARAKAARIAEIKRQAQINIEALTWRLQRAQERDRLGLPGETPEEVMLEREAIRRASNRCEGEINSAQDVSAVQAVTFAVTDADRASPARITRLQFLKRFTDAEMQAIVAAAETNAMLKAALLKWQTAEGIVLTDPATKAGVQALEIAGLIAAGRAAQILAVG